MKFMMVVLICFGLDDCQAIFDDTSWYQTYDECISVAGIAAPLMKDLYPNSAGNIYCMTAEEAKAYHDYIQNGGVIELDLPDVDPASTAV